MKSVVTICQEITTALIADKFQFFYGSRADVNLSLDKFDKTNYNGIIILDPFTKTTKPTTLGVDVWNMPLNLLFGYMQKPDETAEAKRLLQVQAEYASREFWLRFRNYEDVSETVLVWEMGAKKITPFENFDDLNMAGVFMETTATINDTEAICIS